MMFRFVFVLTVMSSAMSVYAEEVDTNNGQAFELTPQPDIVYQPWPGAAPVNRVAMVPPPPPGPYISSGLSELGPGFPGGMAASDKNVTNAQPSPLLRPNAPWPVKRHRPTMWNSEEGDIYAQDVIPAQPVYRSPGYNRPPMPPRMYGQPNYPGNYAQPQRNRQYVEHQRPAWNTFAIPMSRYPQQNQQPRVPAPR